MALPDEEWGDRVTRPPFEPHLAVSSPRGQTPTFHALSYLECGWNAIGELHRMFNVSKGGYVNHQ